MCLSEVLKELAAGARTPALADDGTGTGYIVAVLLEDIDPGESGGITLRNSVGEATFAGLREELLALVLGCTVFAAGIREDELAEPWLPEGVPDNCAIVGRLRMETETSSTIELPMSMEMLPLLLLLKPDVCGARGGLTGRDNCAATTPFVGGGGVAPELRLPDAIRKGCGIEGLDISRDIEILTGPGGVALIAADDVTEAEDAGNTTAD